MQQRHHLRRPVEQLADDGPQAVRRVCRKGHHHAGCARRWRRDRRRGRHAVDHGRRRPGRRSSASARCSSAIGKRSSTAVRSGNGAIVKLCNNLSSQAQIAAAGEILSLGVKAGVDLDILARRHRRRAPAPAARLSTRSPSSCSRATSKTRASQHPVRQGHPPGASSSRTSSTCRWTIGEIVERDKQEALRRGWGPLSPDVFVRLQEERAGVVLEIPKDKTA